MQRYEMMKKAKGSGKSIIATARKIATIVWRMLKEEESFNIDKMVDKKLEIKAQSMRQASESLNQTACLTQEKESPVEIKKENDLKIIKAEKKGKKKPGVAGKNIKNLLKGFLYG